MWLYSGSRKQIGDNEQPDNLQTNAQTWSAEAIKEKKLKRKEVTHNKEKPNEYQFSTNGGEKDKGKK